MMLSGLSMLDRSYRGKRVLVTGHTGFKGGWLTLWLEELGAKVVGFGLPPSTRPSLFNDMELSQSCQHVTGDIRNQGEITAVLRDVRPEVIFHLAAQPLVRRSYEQPLETVQTNIMGTAHVLEAVRLLDQPCAMVIVTSDKCYENREWIFGYREIDAMGGHDVYSMSKGAVELLVSSYRRSFFPSERLPNHGVAIATARAGNVVGGGDWAADRIIPDTIRALTQRRPIPVRNPAAVRPWQHVLEPLAGYLLLGASLVGVASTDDARFCDAWNFGPRPESARTVREVTETVIACWGEGEWEDMRESRAPHEAGLLRLSSEKAQAILGWSPRWDFRTTFERTVDWYRSHHDGADSRELRALTRAQIREYVSSGRVAPEALAAVG
jgi:CDP-glucose 4,6-dehydratase